MIALDFNQDDFYPQWAADKLRIEREYFGNCRTINVLNKNRLTAVVVYSAFNGHNCEVTVAADNKWWIRRDILQILFRYPFDQLGCKRLTLLIRSDNHKVIRLVERIGFEREGCLRSFFPQGDDCIIYGILKEEVKH